MKWNRLCVFVLAMVVAGVASGSLTGQAAAEAEETGTRSTTRSLRFDAEFIRLFIEGDSLRVEGSYRLLCGGTRTGPMTLFYPYPIDSLLGGARSLLLEGRTPPGSWRPLEFAELQDHAGARWRIPLVPGDTLEVRTSYRQALRSTYARYIVTTTAAWGEPLSSARFEIQLPAGMRPTRFSFPFERRIVGERAVYVYEAEQFLPDRDIIVEWEPEPAGRPRTADGSHL